MFNEDSSIALTFNGEIYNHQELRKQALDRGHRFRSNMDGEVILHLYEDLGPKAFGLLNGIFSLAIADRDKRSVVLARDPLGVKPLVYTRHGDGLTFASEIAALAALGSDLGSLDVKGLAQFLTFLWIPDPQTPFSKVSTLPPGHALEFSRDGEIEIERFTPLLVPTPRGAFHDGLIGECRGALTAAVERQLMADVPVGVMASGGVDSSLIWWAGREGISDAYTIAWDTDEEGLSEDAHFVRRLARDLSTPTHYLNGAEVPTDADPTTGDLFADPAYSLTSAIAKAARANGTKVLLAGQGADELFGGYRRHRAVGLLSRMRSGKAGYAARLLQGLPTKGVRAEYLYRVLRAAAMPTFFESYMQLCSYSEASERARALDCYEHEVENDVVWSDHRAFYEMLPSSLSPLRMALSIDLNVYMPGLGLAYMDRAGMSHGVEVRVPWLDLELVRWSLTLPDDALLPDGTGKFLLKEILRRQFGDSMASRPKRGFAVPTGQLRQAQSRGQRGFRQGQYFAHACSVLDRFRRTKLAWASEAA